VVDKAVVRVVGKAVVRAVAAVAGSKLSNRNQRRSKRA